MRREGGGEEREGEGRFKIDYCVENMARELGC